jgi:hypothetical protein
VLLPFTRPLLVAALVSIGVVQSGCRERPNEPPPPPAPTVTEAALPQQRIEPSSPYRYAAAERLVAIGDLHGDLTATRAVLRLAGAIDEADRWVGGHLVLVQTGDQLDRGDDEREILELLDRLVDEAQHAGGAVHVLNGNHEIMNVAGDFRYVTPGGFEDFADVAAEGRVARLAMRAPEKMRGRARAFLPGGVFALRLGKRNTVVIVGRTVFAHGGVLPAHVRYGLGRLNEEIRRWMTGASLNQPPIMDGEDSPIWTRRYSSGTLSAALCAELEGVLRELEADRLVVGHTIQKRGISSACDDKIWRIDVGMARHYGGDIAALEIVRGKSRVLTPSE